MLRKYTKYIWIEIQSQVSPQKVLTTQDWKRTN